MTRQEADTFCAQVNEGDLCMGQQASEEAGASPWGGLCSPGEVAWHSPGARVGGKNGNVEDGRPW